VTRTAWAAALLAGLVLLLNLLNLSAFAYSRYAEARLDRLPDPRAETASSVAQALTPWSARRVAVNGWILAVGGSADASAAAYERALRWAPADPLLWTEYAQALARGRLFDERLPLATRRALALAPNSPAVRQSVSHMGLSYWRHGSPELKELWRQSTRWELDHNRLSFLRSLDDLEYRAPFCRYHAQELGEEAWCQGSLSGAPQ